MASEEVTPPMSRPRLTPAPRWSPDFNAMHVASLGAERPEIPQARGCSMPARSGPRTH